MRAPCEHAETQTDDAKERRPTPEMERRRLVHSVAPQGCNRPSRTMKWSIEFRPEGLQLNQHLIRVEVHRTARGPTAGEGRQEGGLALMGERVASCLRAEGHGAGHDREPFCVPSGDTRGLEATMNGGDVVGSKGVCGELRDHTRAEVPEVGVRAAVNGPADEQLRAVPSPGARRSRRRGGVTTSSLELSLRSEIAGAREGEEGQLELVSRAS